MPISEVVPPCEQSIESSAVLADKWELTAPDRLSVAFDNEGAGAQNALIEKAYPPAEKDAAMIEAAGSLEEFVSIDFYPGFVVKTKRTTGEKVFVNICEGHNIGTMFITQPRVVVDNKGVDCAAYDCLLPQETYRKCTSSEKKIALLEMCDVIRAEITQQYDDNFATDFNVLAKKTYVGAQISPIDVPKSHLLQRVGSIEEGMGSIEEGMGSIEEGVGSIEEGVGSIEEEGESLVHVMSAHTTELEDSTLWLTPPDIRKDKLIKVGASGRSIERQVVLAAGYLTYFEESATTPPFGVKVRGSLLLFGYELLVRNKVDIGTLPRGGNGEEIGEIYKKCIKKMCDPDCQYDLCLVRPEYIKTRLNVARLGPAYLEQTDVLYLQLLPHSSASLEDWENTLTEHATFADRVVKERARQSNPKEAEGCVHSRNYVDPLPITPAVAKRLIYVREDGVLLRAGMVVKSAGIGLGKEDSRLLLLIDYPHQQTSALTYVDEDAMEIKGTFVSSVVAPIAVKRLENENGFCVEGSVRREGGTKLDIMSTFGVTRSEHEPKLEKRDMKFRVEDNSADTWVATIKRVFDL